MAHENGFLKCIAHLKAKEISVEQLFEFPVHIVPCERSISVLAHACKQFHNAMHFQFHKVQEKAREKMTSQLRCCTYCLPERRIECSSAVAEEEAQCAGGARTCKY